MLLEDDAFIEGSLSEQAYNDVKGHYEDDFSNTVDIESTNSIVRVILGGHEDHIYNENICGYLELPNGYMLYVEWENEKYAYYYAIENGTEKLYINTVDEWHPSMSNFMYDGAQCYIKQSSEAFSKDKEPKVKISTDNPWGLDGANEGFLPENIYELIKGSYYAASKGISVKIISPTEILYNEGDGEITLNIEGCDQEGYSLYIYVSGNDGAYAEYQNTLLIWYADNQDDLMIMIGNGSWNAESFNVSALRVPD